MSSREIPWQTIRTRKKHINILEIYAQYAFWHSELREHAHVLLNLRGEIGVAVRTPAVVCQVAIFCVSVDLAETKIVTPRDAAINALWGAQQTRTVQRRAPNRDTFGDDGGDPDVDDDARRWR